MWSILSSSAQNAGTELNSMINRQDFSFLGYLLDIDQLLSHKEICKRLLSEGIHVYISERLFQKVISNLLKSSIGDASESLSLYAKAFQKLLKYHPITTNPEIYTKIVKSIVKSLFKFGQISDEPVQYFQKLVRDTKPKQKTMNDSPFLTTFNTLINFYFIRNNFNLAYQQFESLKKGFYLINEDVFSSSEVASFYFNLGKVDAIFGRYTNSKTNLTKALSHIPNSNARDRRLVYSFLIPVNMLFGQIPSKELLENYSMNIYNELVIAMQIGDLSLYEASLEQNQMVFIRLGVWEIIAQIRNLVERRIVEIVHHAYANNIIDIEVFQAAFAMFFDNPSIEEVELILANLIGNGLVRAYIYHYKKKVVFSKDNPFPKIKLDTEPDE